MSEPQVSGPELKRKHDPSQAGNGADLRSVERGLLGLQGSAGNQALSSGAVNAKVVDPVARDCARLKERIDRIDAFRDGKMERRFASYIQLMVEHQDVAAQTLLRIILFELDNMRAFEIPYHLYNRWWAAGHQALAEEASHRTRTVHLWSKMTQYTAMKAANAHGEEGEGRGISLEGSLGGYLFDGLSFGLTTKSSATMDLQWKLVSHTFVNHAGGTGEVPAENQTVVHAHVLIGVPVGSVLDTTEWDALSPRLGKSISRLVIHRYLLDGVDGTMHQHDETEISEPGQWGKFRAANQRQGEKGDHRGGESVITVPLRRIKTSKGEKMLVVRLTLYMNEEDWRRLRVYAAPVGSPAQQSQHPEEPGQQSPFHYSYLTPLYSSMAPLRETGTDDEGKKVMKDAGGEMLGVQNLVQQSHMRLLTSYDKELWADGERAKEDYLRRLRSLAEAQAGRSTGAGDGN